MGLQLHGTEAIIYRAQSRLCLLGAAKETHHVVANIGPYRILRELGSGGMGRAYLALDGENRAVAVKVLHPHLAVDEDILRRLAREGKTLKSVRSPYVAHFLDLDLLSSPPYIVTEYADGPTLWHVVKETGPLPEEAIYTLAVGLAAALDAIHAAGVVHRDLTPSNVLLVAGSPMVIDFGLSQAVDATRMTADFIGTPGFVAPEVLDGARPSPASDVFAWAVTVIFAATGTNCFRAETLAATLHRTINEDPEIAWLPPDLAPVLWRCLRKNPGERPTTQSLIGCISAFSPNTPLPHTLPERSSLDVLFSDLWIEAGEARTAGDLQRATQLYEKVERIAARTGDVNSQKFALYQLGFTAEGLGDLDAAEHHYGRTRKFAASDGSPNIEAMTLQALERIARRRGDTSGEQMYGNLLHQVLNEKQGQGYSSSLAKSAEKYMRRMRGKRSESDH